MSKFEDTDGLYAHVTATRPHVDNSRTEEASTPITTGQNSVDLDDVSQLVKSHGHGPKRLGKPELGRYAGEETMPRWLSSMLNKGGESVTDGIIPVFRQLLEQCNTTEYAYLCHPAVKHISKMRLEGGFCGYRNIQMLVSYICGSRAEGSDVFQGQIPSVFEIQDLIEKAWDKGINTQGRAETGGIRGTRKYIGTSEAQAMFVSLGIPCHGQAYMDKKAGISEAQVFKAVEKYFDVGTPREGPAKVTSTELPPIYFQHAGHSLTIVGFEKQKNGTLNLLVFDPSQRDESSIIQMAGRVFRHRNPDKPLSTYRRNHKYLRRYREFEVLTLGRSLS